MVCPKWSGQNGLDKMIWSKWSGQNECMYVVAWKQKLFVVDTFSKVKPLPNTTLFFDKMILPIDR